MPNQKFLQLYYYTAVILNSENGVFFSIKTISEFSIRKTKSNNYESETNECNEKSNTNFTKLFFHNSSYRFTKRNINIFECFKINEKNIMSICKYVLKSQN